MSFFPEKKLRNWTEYCHFPPKKNSIQDDWSIFSNHFSEIFNKNLEKNTTSSKQKWRILKTNKDENKISKKLSGRVETKEIHITQYTIHIICSKKKTSRDRLQRFCKFFFYIFTHNRP